MICTCGSKLRTLDTREAADGTFRIKRCDTCGAKLHTFEQICVRVPGVRGRPKLDTVEMKAPKHVQAKRNVRVTGPNMKARKYIEDMQEQRELDAL